MTEIRRKMYNQEVEGTRGIKQGGNITKRCCTSWDFKNPHAVPYSLKSDLNSRFMLLLIRIVLLLIRIVLLSISIVLHVLGLCVMSLAT